MAPQPREPPSICKECKLEFPSWDDFHKHKLSSSKHITCQYCSRDFKTRAACSRHTLQNHAATQNLKCSTCGKKFVRLGPLVSHLENERCGETDGLTFEAKYVERKTHYDNVHNVSQVHDFGPTSGNFAAEPENQVRSGRGSGSGQASRDVSEHGGPSNSVAIAAAPIPSIFGNPAANNTQHPPAANTGPVFKTSAPTLNPIYHPPPVDLMSDDPLPADPPSMPKADEDLISFDEEREYENFYAQEVLKAPLSMKTADVKAIASDKAGAAVAKKKEDLKSKLAVTQNLASKENAKPTFSPVKVASEFPQLASQQFKNGGLDGPNIMDAAVKSSAASNAWGVKKNLFPNAPPAVAPPTEVLASMTIDKPKIEEGTRYSEFDTTNPMFNIRKYWVPVLEKFKCPIPLCNKSFDKEVAFRNHLNSQAHVNGRFKCRNCCKYFKSAGALSQHSESQGQFCEVRDTDQYEACVDEFAASHVTIAGKHADNTIRYAVVQKAASRSTTMQAAHEEKNKAYQDDYDTYWKRTRPEW